MHALSARPAALKRSGGRVGVQAARAGAITSVGRDLIAGRGWDETFSVELLGNENMTQQTLPLREGTSLLPLSIPRPLGVVFAERRRGLSSETEAFVEEVGEGSNAERAGVRVGDVLRLTTCVVEVRGKVDVLSYYANPPKAANRRALLVADGTPFSKLMKAIVSNATPVDLATGESRAFDEIALVLERAS